MQNGSNFMISHENKTIVDGLPLSFTMSGEDFKKCRNNIRKLTTREYLPPAQGEQYPSKKLPIEERWSARSFDLQTVFSPLKDNTHTHLETQFFFDNRNWSDYKEMMAAKKVLNIPEKELLKPRLHAKIPYVD